MQELLGQQLQQQQHHWFLVSGMQQIHNRGSGINVDYSIVSTYNVKLDSFTVLNGTASDMSSSALDVQDQMGKNDTWDDYVEFSNGCVGMLYVMPLTTDHCIVEFNFVIPNDLQLATLSALTLLTNARSFNTPTTDIQWSAYNFVTGQVRR